MTNKVISNLPPTIMVHIKKTIHGKYFAKLTKFDVFTEADSKEELDFQINDLIFCLFDVPKQYHSKITYRPMVNRPTDLTKVNTLNIFVSPEVDHNFI